MIGREVYPYLPPILNKKGKKPKVQGRVWEAQKGKKQLQENSKNPGFEQTLLGEPETSIALSFSVKAKKAGEPGERKNLTRSKGTAEENGKHVSLSKKRCKKGQFKPESPTAKEEGRTLTRQASTKSIRENTTIDPRHARSTRIAASGVVGSGTRQ